MYRQPRSWSRSQPAVAQDPALHPRQPPSTIHVFRAKASKTMKKLFRPSSRDASNNNQPELATLRQNDQSRKSLASSALIASEDASRPSDDHLAKGSASPLSQEVAIDPPSTVDSNLDQPHVASLTKTSAPLVAPSSPPPAVPVPIQSTPSPAIQAESQSTTGDSQNTQPRPPVTVLPDSTTLSPDSALNQKQQHLQASRLKPPSDGASAAGDSGYGSSGTGSKSSPIPSPRANANDDAHLSLHHPPSNVILTSSPKSLELSLPNTESSHSLGLASLRPTSPSQLNPTSPHPISRPRSATTPAPTSSSSITVRPPGKTHLRLRLDTPSHPLPVIPLPPHSPSVYAVQPPTPHPPGGFHGWGTSTGSHVKAVSEPAPPPISPLNAFPLMSTSSGATSPPVGGSTGSRSIIPTTPSPAPTPGRQGILRLVPTRSATIAGGEQSPAPASPITMRLPRAARPSMPALRRDGSFYYTVAPSDESPPHDDEDHDDALDSDGSDMEIDDGEPMSDDEDVPPVESKGSTPMLGRFGTGLKAMVSGITGSLSPSLSSGAGLTAGSPVLPKPTSPMTPTSVVRTPSASSSSSTAVPSNSLTIIPNNDNSQGSGDVFTQNPTIAITASTPIISSPPTPIAHTSTLRLRERPRQIVLTPMHEDEEDAQHHDPARNRDTIYETPLSTPTAATGSGWRESVYYDADDGDYNPAGLTSSGFSVDTTATVTTNRSAFSTMHSGASTGTLTPKGHPLELSASSIEAGAATPTPRSPSTNAANTKKPDFSALGLQFTQADLDAHSTNNTSDADSLRTARRVPSSNWDYFSHKSPHMPTTPATPSTSGSPDPPKNASAMLLTPRTPYTTMLKTPKTPGGRPVMYSHTSHSMIDFGSMRIEDMDVTPSLTMPALQTPKPSVKGKERSNSGAVDAVAEQLSVPPSVASATTTITRSPPPPFSRRMSLPNLAELSAAVPPPPYPYPKTDMPREEEGREVLPRYSCGIHFEASMPRKMEFSSPGVLARDRAWKRVWVVLSGTGLWIYKQDPRRWNLKPSHSSSTLGGHGAAKSVGGRRGDGVVDVDDLMLSAPHVHLPIQVLQAHLAEKGNRGGEPSMRRTSSMGSSGSGGGARASADSAMTTPCSSTVSIGRPSSSSRRSAETSSAIGSTLSAVAGFASSAVGGPRVSGSTLSVNGESGEASSSPQPDSEKVPLSTSNPTTNCINTTAGPASSSSSGKHIHIPPSSSLLAPFQQNQLLKSFSLQNAETGLASDYHKRRNVVRIRAAGEQFLLQTDSMMMTVDWIETFQAAANVSLDLDVRPMPKVPAFPRRRRRRRPADPAAPGATAGDTSTAANGEANPDQEPEPPAATPSNHRHSRLRFGRRS